MGRGYGLNVVIQRCGSKEIGLLVGKVGSYGGNQMETWWNNL